MINIQLELNKLLDYALNNKLIQPADYYYAANRLIDLLKLTEFQKLDITTDYDFYKVMDNILQYAYEQGIIESDTVLYKDLFDSAIMDCLMPRPSEVNQTFWSLYLNDPKEATDYFYNLSQKSNYIRVDRTSKNISWKTPTEYGELDITINVSKPEKDPRDIAKARNLPKTSYPKCVLCRENEGFSGNLNHPSRHNHRIINLKLNNENWFLQYSPYVYYNEHCIVLSEHHVPMKISTDTFKRLLDFVDLFPHYFIGSNADLPIVGGSILSHDHFQGGRYEFAMMKQGFKETFTVKDYPDVEAGIVNWPMSAIRLLSTNKVSIIKLSERILTLWKEYSDYEVDIYAYTDDTPHNTITPITRKVNNRYEMTLVLRNNRTTPEHPLGLFHPHSEHHHIKKENIGLIEVMGLAVLPGRLKDEIPLIKHALLTGEDFSSDSDMYKHQAWVESLRRKYDEITENNVDWIIKTEIGEVFKDILAQCGVFKDTKSFMRFIKLI